MDGAQEIDYVGRLTRQPQTEKTEIVWPFSRDIPSHWAWSSRAIPAPRNAETSISWQVGNVKKTVRCPMLRDWASGSVPGVLLVLRSAAARGGI